MNDQTPNLPEEEGRNVGAENWVIRDCRFGSGYTLLADEVRRVPVERKPDLHEAGPDSLSADPLS